MVPHVLLHMTWQQAHHLAGYEQQVGFQEFLLKTIEEDLYTRLVRLIHGLVFT